MLDSEKVLREKIQAHLAETGCTNCDQCEDVRRLLDTITLLRSKIYRLQKAVPVPRITIKDNEKLSTRLVYIELDDEAVHHKTLTDVSCNLDIGPDGEVIGIDCINWPKRGKHAKNTD